MARTLLKSKLLLALTALTCAYQSAIAEEPAKKSPTQDYLKLKVDRDKNATALQTSIVRFVPQNGNGDVFVDLVGAVHIGDMRYYEQLNDEFQQYDVLLYELVAPPERRIPTKDLRESKDLLTLVRKIAQILFEFEMQLDGVDYTKKNFVHADLGPKEMAENLKKRGETPLTLFLGMMLDSLRQQNRQELTTKKEPIAKMPEMDLMQVIQDPNGATKIKRAFAIQMMTSIDASADPNSTLNRILILDRNIATMNVLKRELAKGHKKIGIFYGAAHMPDFEQRLKSDFNMKQQSLRWVTAWNLDMKYRSKAEHIQKFIQIVELLQKHL